MVKQDGCHNGYFHTNTQLFHLEFKHFGSQLGTCKNVQNLNGFGFFQEQMVLRHHNEAESLNAVQKMDWEWKLKELSGTNPTNSDTLPPIDDLHIPMVHVSDDFDLDRT